MNQTMYTAISGMNAFQQALSVTSNNIANANTTGYKKQSVVFNDLLYQNTMGSVAGGLYAGTNPMSFGSGSKIGAILISFTHVTVVLQYLTKIRNGLRNRQKWQRFKR
ncbi:Flagellar basal-body rod protein flgG [Listeria monocytogenes]|nr:Flagellar basal-body rod protein flgG [Listeria monocytogenes]